MLCLMSGNPLEGFEMKKSPLHALFGAAVAMAVFLGPASAASYLVNGSFETGDLSGWTTSGNFGFTQVESGPFYVFGGAQNGNYYVAAGSIGSLGFISQTFADVPGEALQISGWLIAVADDPSEFSVSFNGTPLVDVSNPDTSGIWQTGSFNVVATGSDTLTIGFRDDPAYIGFDNFSVTSVNATPLPATLPLFAGGLGLLGLVARRRKKKGIAAA